MKFAVALVPFVAYLASSASATETESSVECPERYFPRHGQCLPDMCKTETQPNNPRCRVYPNAMPSCPSKFFPLDSLCYPNKCKLRIYKNDPACRHSDFRAQCPTGQYPLDNRCFPNFCMLKIWTDDQRCKTDLLTRDRWGHGSNHDSDDPHWHNNSCDEGYILHKEHSRTCVWHGCYSESERKEDNGQHCCPTDVVGQ